MIISLKIKNYRCFSEHNISFPREAILVGRNNAGKSTVIECLRLISIVTQRYKNLNFKQPEPWTDLPSSHHGARISLSGMNISWNNIFHRYGNPPAEITATFSNGSQVSIYIGPDKGIHAVILNENNKVVQTKTQAKKIYLPIISVLPQISPLLKEEKLLNQDYIQRNISSHFASQHFRNQLHYQKDFFNEFKMMSEKHWPKLQIRDLTVPLLSETDDFLKLLVRDADFVAEVGWMGHGLQMWLQIMWFIARSKNSECIILDEPDVYMHPDLQRKLLTLLRGKNEQVIIATHSIEILSNTQPNNIIIIEKTRNSSNAATNIPAVQRILNSIGSTQNISLTRLWNAKKFLIIEGKDIKFLSILQTHLFPQSDCPFDTIPRMSIGGWGGWSSAIGTAMFLKNAFDENIIIYCIFDSDYHLSDEIAKRISEGKTKNISVHIWKMKEIENYLLHPNTILRFISSKTQKNINIQIIKSILSQICNDMKEDVIENYLDSYTQNNKFKQAKTLLHEARNYVENKWKCLDDKLTIVSGKAVISKLAKWAQDEYKVTLNSSALLYELQPNEIKDEVKNIISSIEQSAPFDNYITQHCETG
jgi:energy-coupling factor transporter ATP-binding protein EcfA2